VGAGLGAVFPFEAVIPPLPPGPAGFLVCRFFCPFVYDWADEDLRTFPVSTANFCVLIPFFSVFGPGLVLDYFWMAARLTFVGLPLTLFCCGFPPLASSRVLSPLSKISSKRFVPFPANLRFATGGKGLLLVSVW